MNQFDAEQLIREALEEKDEVFITKLVKSSADRRALRNAAILLESRGYCRYVRDIIKGKWKIMLTKKTKRERYRRQLENFEAVLEEGQLIVFELVLPEEHREFRGTNFPTLKLYNRKTGILPELVKKYMGRGFTYVPGDIHRRSGYLIMTRDLYPLIASKVCQPLSDGTQFELKPTDLDPEEVWRAYYRDEGIKKRLELEDELDSSYFR